MKHVIFKRLAELSNT